MRFQSLLWLAVLARAYGAGPCDPDIVKLTDPLDASRYQERPLGSDRCEGWYLQQQSSTIGPMLVASLTMSGHEPKAWGRATTLNWESAGNDEIYVHMIPLKPRLYYRVDILLRKKSTSYNWDTVLIADSPIVPSELGLVAWTLGAGQRRIYLPLSYEKTSATSTPMSYKLVVVSPIELKKIYVKVAKDAMRDTAQRIALKEDFYPADHKIEIVLPRLPSVGLYAVEVTGEGDNRRTTTTGTFLIRHSQ